MSNKKDKVVDPKEMGRIYNEHLGKLTRRILEGMHKAHKEAAAAIQEEIEKLDKKAKK